MSDSENRDQRVATNVRRIEEAADHLDHTLEETREAVHRANKANSMASPGIEDTVSEAEPAGDKSSRREDKEHAYQEHANKEHADKEHTNEKYEHEEDNQRKG